MTARARSSGGCCTTRRPSSRTSSRPWSGPAGRAARSTPTSPCSPTGCGPSGNRASRSTWRTATSPRHGGRSSSPTPPATSSTPATWSPVPTADLAIVLVDARNGLTEQSRRHAFLTTLLRVPHLVLAVNKMDLVGYDPDVFERIIEEFSAFAAKLEVGDLTFIPISALHGDNVVQRSVNMGWYDGPSLLHHLEHVHIASDRNLIDVRFPVQYVIRPHQA